MSAYSDWKAEALTDDEYRSAMRRECGDDSPREELPFYTDDTDDPHWKCENCRHCNRYGIKKRVVDYRCWVDKDGYVHNNRKKPETLMPTVGIGSDYIYINICNRICREVSDDDYCAEFSERENNDHDYI